MYTSDLRKKLNVPTPPLGAPKMQLHRGFWAAYQAVDKQLMQEVNKQLKLVKVGSTSHSKPVVSVRLSLGLQELCGGSSSTITEALDRCNPSTHHVVPKPTSSKPLCWPTSAYTPSHQCNFKMLCCFV
jgi:hypothetical protein